MWYYKINTYKNIRQVTYVQNIIIIPIETMKSDRSMGSRTGIATDRHRAEALPLQPAVR